MSRKRKPPPQDDDDFDPLLLSSPEPETPSPRTKRPRSVLQSLGDSAVKLAEGARSLGNFVLGAITSVTPKSIVQVLSPGRGSVVGEESDDEEEAGDIEDVVICLDDQLEQAEEPEPEPAPTKRTRKRKQSQPKQVEEAADQPIQLDDLLLDEASDGPVRRTPSRGGQASQRRLASRVSAAKPKPKSAAASKAKPAAAVPKPKRAPARNTKPSNSIDPTPTAFKPAGHSSKPKPTSASAGPASSSAAAATNTKHARQLKPSATGRSSKSATDFRQTYRPSIRTPGPKSDKQLALYRELLQSYGGQRAFTQAAPASLPKGTELFAQFGMNTALSGSQRANQSSSFKGAATANVSRVRFEQGRELASSLALNLKRKKSRTEGSMGALPSSTRRPQPVKTPAAAAALKKKPDPAVVVLDEEDDATASAKGGKPQPISDDYARSVQATGGDLLSPDFVARFQRKLALEREDHERQVDLISKKLAEAESAPPTPPDTEFSPLPDEIEEKLDALLEDGAPEDIVATHFGIDIIRQDLHTLTGLNWLNDNVVTCFFLLVGKRSAENPSLPKTWCHNTHFYEKYCRVGYQGVRRWTKKVKEGIFALEQLIVPVHLHTHWACGMINFKDKRIEYYDSMNLDPAAFFKDMRNYLQSESQEKLKQPFDFEGWRNFTSPSCPQQGNGSDCGVFACKFADFLSRGKTPEFSQNDMPYFRRRVMWEVASGALMS
eukprot:m.204774 g.204774  ORF g.204774 m.204774 type:complete len:720 (+) comp18476_c0_seq1:120-2279(+)